MRVVVLYESMTGNTRRAAELIGGAAASRGAQVGVHPVTDPDLHELSIADVVFIGTWVDGLVLFGQRPGRVAHLRGLPVLDHKPVAVFCTYAINAGNALKKTATVLEERGARILTGQLFRRDKLDEGLDDFVDDVLAAVATLA